MGKNKPYVVTRDKFMNREQVRTLLKTVGEMAELDLLLGRRVWIQRNMLVSLALRTGMRCAEMRDLKHGDIHITGKETYLTVRCGKGGKPRDCYFNGELSKHLKRYTDIKRKSWGMDVTDNSYLFSHRDGRSYTTTALHIAFKRALEKAGIPSGGWEGKPGKKLPPWAGGKRKEGYHIHSARHTHATLLLQDTGGDLQAVRRQLGHSSLSMVIQYAECLPEHRQAALNKLGI
jgi:integrase